MDWKTFAVDRLKQYEAKRGALESLPLQIAEVESMMTSIRSAGTDAVSVKGGGSGYDDKMINCLIEKEELQWSLKCTKLWTETTNKALSVLAPTEKRILERFYLIGGRNAAEDLATEFYADRKSIYRWKDDALRKFTIALYGRTES